MFKSNKIIRELTNNLVILLFRLVSTQTNQGQNKRKLRIWSQKRGSKIRQNTTACWTMWQLERLVLKKESKIRAARNCVRNHHLQIDNNVFVCFFSNHYCNTFPYWSRFLIVLSINHWTETSSQLFARIFSYSMSKIDYALQTGQTPWPSS